MFAAFLNLAVWLVLTGVFIGSHRSPEASGAALMIIITLGALAMEQG